MATRNIIDFKYMTERKCAYDERSTFESIQFVPHITVGFLFSCLHPARLPSAVPSRPPRLCHLISHTTHLTQLISHNSPHTTHLTHNSSHTTHHTQLISHHSSHTTHLTQLISHTTHLRHHSSQTQLISHNSSHTTHLTPLISSTTHLLHLTHHSSHTPLISRGAVHKASCGARGRSVAAAPRCVAGAVHRAS